MRLEPCPSGRTGGACCSWQKHRPAVLRRCPRVGKDSLGSAAHPMSGIGGQLWVKQAALLLWSSVSKNPKFRGGVSGTAVLLTLITNALLFPLVGRSCLHVQIHLDLLNLLTVLRLAQTLKWGGRGKNPLLPVQQHPSRDEEPTHVLNL